MTLSFWIGLIIGVLIPVALLVWGARRHSKPQAPSGPDKLAEARKYLTVISTTTSLHNAQKVAHKALKVTE